MSDLTGSQKIDTNNSQFPKNIQLLLNRIRTTVTKAVPRAEETLKYGIPTLRMKTNLLHYATF